MLIIAQNIIKRKKNKIYLLSIRTKSVSTDKWIKEPQASNILTVFIYNCWVYSTGDACCSQYGVVSPVTQVTVTQHWH